VSADGAAGMVLVQTSSAAARDGPAGGDPLPDLLSEETDGDFGICGYKTTEA